MTAIANPQGAALDSGVRVRGDEMLRELIADLFGCRHDNLTRPITPAHKIGEDPGETYVACLNCGKRLKYDLRTMKVGKPLPASKSAPSFQIPYK